MTDPPDKGNIPDANRRLHRPREDAQGRRLRVLPTAPALLRTLGRQAIGVRRSGLPQPDAERPMNRAQRRKQRHRRMDLI